MEDERQYGRPRSIRRPQVYKPEERPEQPEVPARPEAKERPQQEQAPPQKTTSEIETEREPTGAQAPPEKPSRPPYREERRYRPRPKEKGPKPEEKRHPYKAPRDKRAPQIKLSVVVPAYDEEDNVEPLLTQFDDLLARLPYRAEMIFVDDGSTDRTLIRAKEGQMKYQWLKVYSHRTNLGLTAALETGFAKALGRVVCFFPADLQYHANEIPKMVSKIDLGVDIVTGWKKGSYGLKSLASFFYNSLSRLLFKVKVHDLNSIKAFRKEVIDHFAYRSGWHRYMVVMAADAGYTVDEVRVKLYPRRSGKSKFGFWRLPTGFLDLLSVKFQLSFTRKPLLFFGSAGLLSMFLGVVVGLVAVYLRFFHGTGYRPLLYMVILLVVSGLMLFAIGFLAELIVSIKEDLSRRHDSHIT